MCGKHGNICAHRTSVMLWMPDQITLKTSPNQKFQKETARLYLQDRVSIRSTREGRAVFFSSTNKRLTWPKGSKPCVQFWLNGQWYSPLYGHNLPQNPRKSATSWTSQGVEPVEHIFQLDNIFQPTLSSLSGFASETTTTRCRSQSDFKAFEATSSRVTWECLIGSMRILRETPCETPPSRIARDRCIFLGIQTYG